MSDKTSIQLVNGPQEFFLEMLSSALQAQRVKVQPETEVYMLNLLQHFMRPENLYVQNGEGGFEEKPLAFLVMDALEEDHPEASKAIFRKIGDVSLYTAGYFYERLAQKKVGRDYYIDIGESAYTTVAAKNPERPQKEVFEELSAKFGKLVDVFAEISDRTLPRDEVSLLRQYENWSESGDKRIEKNLIKAGILIKGNRKN